GFCRLSTPPAPTLVITFVSQLPAPVPCVCCRSTACPAAKPAGVVTVAVDVPEVPATGESGVDSTVGVLIVSGPLMPVPKEAQAPATQVLPAGQMAPQAPQLLSSIWVLVQIAFGAVPQTSGLARGQAQPPERQPPPVGQTTPQAPQLAGSSFSLVQNWLGAVPHRFGSFAGQVQVEVTQLWPVAQTFPHVPQLFG